MVHDMGIAIHQYLHDLQIQSFVTFMLQRISRPAFSPSSCLSGKSSKLGKLKYSPFAVHTLSILFISTDAVVAGTYHCTCSFVDPHEYLLRRLLSFSCLDWMFGGTPLEVTERSIVSPPILKMSMTRHG